MTGSTFRASESERGVALVFVLLLTAVMAALATGLTLSSQTEIAMATNEQSYVSTRAAAEAGLNQARAAIATTTFHPLRGPDDLTDPANPGAAVNADNGLIDQLLTGGPPYAVGATGQYSFTILVLDDDDPRLHPGGLSPEQLAAMGGENSNGLLDSNNRLILMATGMGPFGTTVQLKRFLSFDPAVEPPPVIPPPVETNPAIVVDGNLTISGNPTIDGSNGSVHANGDLTISGNPTIERNATASGDYSTSGSPNVGGVADGNQPSLVVPDMHAADLQHLASHVLTEDGRVVTLDDPATVPNESASCNAPCKNWEISGGTWVISGNSATAGTYFVEGPGGVKISGNPGSPANPVPVSIISQGSVEVSGNPWLTPHPNAQFYQFVTDGDLKLGGTVDLDPMMVTVEGRSYARNQLMISGNPDIRGRIVVKDFATEDPIKNIVDFTGISGNPDITYNGSFDDLLPPAPPPVPPVVIYTNNVLGWLES